MSTIAGCLFHLVQAFWGRIQLEGINEDYMREENSELRVHFHSLIALIFISVDVTLAFYQLREVVEEELLPIFDYA
ncbi:hypothetical protein ANN_25830 [Periplaneta americana]|uniref:Uncharacterized protein n=1 Tax=Periplaneta americana TaxID=6978 RepID=A0ABQ8S4N6_PERAM|nr:hypothetical protein ANN_25830 [Periplaneta americana]